MLAMKKQLEIIWPVIPLKLSLVPKSFETLAHLF